ncbi:MAG: non-ribosomal peptide synthetase [Candidatus Angelobacter sp. Gp1-AA117]|nr:MAG: non-ribosomal peptide synthetase [Candidatus Angelobacter sp. Gp1-AA117]
MNAPTLKIRPAVSRQMASNLVELLRGRAAEQPERNIYTFLAEDTDPETDLSFGELDRRARAVAAWLQEAGATDGRVLLLFTAGLDYITAFFGCLYARVVAVPAYPPRMNRGFDRLEAIIQDATPLTVLTTSAILTQIESRADHHMLLEGRRWGAVDTIGNELAEAWREPVVNGETLAFLQYTSGSTAKPKGVMVSHGNLLHNQKMIQEAFGQSAESIIAGWLPLFHDMGLIGNVLQPLYVGARCILLSPMAFLQRPLSWLQTISQYRATTSGGPNFAYDLCVRKIRSEEREKLDLSSWAVAFNGAEPVQPATLERFVSAFAACGFRRSAFYPCYGLAEATLFVAGGTRENGPVVTAFEKNSLQSNHSIEALPQSQNATELVSCGKEWLDQRIRIVDPNMMIACKPGTVGEIWVAGPSVAQGYWNRPEESSHTFKNFLLKNDGPYLRTGDLGLVAKGQLFITGRWKDLIIIRGRNHYPQDIERTVERCHPSLRAGEVAAFSVDVAGEERLVIVQEVARNHRQQDLRAVAETIRQAVAEKHELQVYALSLIKPGSILKTSSGKIQRRAIREAFNNAALQVVFQSQAGETAEVHELATPETREQVAEWIASQLAARLGLKGAEIDMGQPIVRYGADSLAALELAHNIEAALGVSLPVSTLLADSSISEIAAQVFGLTRARGNVPADTITSSSSQKQFSLSRGQAALWFLHRLAPESAAYNVAGAARVHGPIDVEALKQAFQKLTARHSQLRAWFESGQDALVQVIEDGAALDFQQADVSGWPGEKLQQTIEEEAQKPFRLEQAPLFRVRWFADDSGQQVLLLVAHHIIVDLWSLAVLLRELGEIYHAEASGRNAKLPRLKLSYRDYVAWQAQMLAGREGEQLWSYWKQQLSGELPVLDLATDHPRPAVQSYHGASESMTISPEVLAGLKKLAHNHGATLFTLILSAYQVLLQKYTGQPEILTGYPTMGRSRAGFESIAGYFVNTVVVRSRIHPGQTFHGLLSNVRQTVLGAFEHQDYPFEMLVDRLQPERDPGRTPLFQTMFAFESVPKSSHASLAAFALGEQGTPCDLDGLVLEPIKLRQHAAQFDLTLGAAEINNTLAISLNYNTELLEAATITRMLEHFKVLAESIVYHPEMQISDLPILTPAEQRELLGEFNATAKDYPAGICLHQLFERRAEETPDAIAVQCRSEHLTYGQLNSQAENLAHDLRRLGVGAEVPVGILLERGIPMIVGMLGILKTGGVYVPLDPAYPQERLAFTLEDAKVKTLITEPQLGAVVPQYQGAKVFINSADETSPSPAILGCPVVHEQNLAYVIYTSGSTGRPKGVAIEHRSAATLVHWAKEVYERRELDVVLFSTSICFDLSVFELFVPLSCGGTVFVVQDALELLQSPYAGALTLINTVPSALWELVRNSAIPGSVTTINLAGEPLLRDLVQEAYKKPNIRRVFNLYGPSEDTTYSTYALVEKAGENQPTIGRPIANSAVYIARDGGLLLPAGIAGELCIGGAGLARGYLHQPDLTAQKFVPDSVSGNSGTRLYKTGDLARHRANGEIEFLGRLDHQVKVRGFRIELGEIEAALKDHDGIKEAVVVAREDRSGDKQIVAYVVPKRAEEFDIAELREKLKRFLPHYMLPQAFVPLMSMPLTRNGKIDRRALPAPDQSAAKSQEFVKPRTAMEQAVAAIWMDVLNVEQISVTDNFFHLGGHSLKTTQVVTRIASRFDVELPLRAVFESPTVEELSRKVEQAIALSSSTPIRCIERVSREQDLPLSFSQQRLWFLHQIAPESPAYNIAYAAHFWGRLNIAALEQSIWGIVSRHEVLRTTFIQAEDQPRQVVHPEISLCIRHVDLRHLAAQDRQTHARELAKTEAQRPFDLQESPLLRIAVMQKDEEEYALLAVMHHIVSDGWSLGIFMRELASNYEAFSSGTPANGPELSVQYADIAVWQRQWIEEAVQAQFEYWKRQLGSMTGLLDLPLDRPRPAVQSGRGASLEFSVPRSTAALLNELAQQQDATLFMVLAGALKILLARYSGQPDIAVGTVIANRKRVEEEPLIGCFVNTLVLRTQLSGDPIFIELLQNVRSTTLEAYANQDVPFEKIAAETDASRDLGRSPLFQVMLVLQNAPLGKMELQKVRLELEEIETQTAKFDLTVQFTECEQGLQGKLEYSTDLFNPGTAERMAAHLQSLLGSIASDPQQRISEMPLLCEAEKRQLLKEWNCTSRLYPDRECVHDLFARQAQQTPDAIAVAYGSNYLTYKELDRRSNQLARYLQKLGTGSEQLVGICMERCPEMLVALVSVLKAGAAYLPMDVRYPGERLTYVLNDAGVKVLLSDKRSLERLPEHAAEIICLDTQSSVIDGESTHPIASGATSDNLAYVIYTSGSQGLPKGVMVSHGSLVNLASWHNGTYGVTPEDKASQFAGFAFDAATWEIWPYLFAGASLHLPSTQIEEAPAEWLKMHEISICFLPTPLAEATISDLKTELPLRYLLTGGDRLHRTEKTFNFTLVNHYGPTEATVVASAAPVDTGFPGDPPIGRPIANTELYILDKFLEPNPVGVAGELLIGGDGVGRGYWQRPELTADRFIPDPYSGRAGARMYRSGDLCRYLADGMIEYKGRIDHQVKIRGFRIELGEIESVLQQHECVREAVVLAHESPGASKRLIAYVVPDKDSPSAGELAAYLRDRVPEYMVPSAFVTLLSIQIVSRALRVGLKLSALQVFQHQTLAALAAVAEDIQIPAEAAVVASRTAGQKKRAPEDFPHIRISQRELELVIAGREEDIDEIYPLTALQQGMLFHVLDAPGAGMYLNQQVYTFHGDLDAATLLQAFQRVVDRHQILRSAFVLTSQGEAFQIVFRNVILPWQQHEWSAQTPEEQEENLDWLLTSDRHRGFQISQSPLVRLTLINVGRNKYHLVWSCHLILLDGWSIPLIFSEALSCYEGLRSNTRVELPPPVSPAGYLQWLQRQDESRARAYWQGALQGFSRATPLGDDRASIGLAELEAQYREETLLFSEAETDTLKSFAASNQLTPNSLVQGAWALHLARRSGSEDVVFGAVASGRPPGLPGVEAMVGLFLNTLPVRVRIAPEASVLGWLKELQAQQAEAREFEFSPLVHIQGWSPVPRSQPLFESVVVFQNVPIDPELLAPGRGIQLEAMRNIERNNYVLTILVVPGKEWLLKVVYNERRFLRSTIKRMAGQLHRLLLEMASAPEQPLSSLSASTQQERGDLIAAFNEGLEVY